jgi:hypothetical protein
MYATPIVLAPAFTATRHHFASFACTCRPASRDPPELVSADEVIE